MKKYAIHPGMVRSKNDGDLHFISFKKLCRLYGVNPEECFKWSDSCLGHHWGNYEHLYPKYDGDYQLEGE